MKSQSCIRKLGRTVDEQIRLVCFPHAGAGASIFGAWTPLLPDFVGTYGVQLAGREQRSSEPLVVEWTPHIEEISDALANFGDIPFVFYGHSLGGLIAYNVARALQRRDAAGPRMLVVGGAHAPSAVCKAGTHFHDEASLLRSVRRFGGVDDELLADVEFADHFLPVIAADLTLFNRYVYNPTHADLECPVVAMFGALDPDHGKECAAKWRQHTRGEFLVQEVGGGHFFHRERARETVELVVRCLDHRAE